MLASSQFVGVHGALHDGQPDAKHVLTCNDKEAICTHFLNEMFPGSLQVYVLYNLHDCSAEITGGHGETTVYMQRP